MTTPLINPSSSRRLLIATSTITVYLNSVQRSFVAAGSNCLLGITHRPGQPKQRTARGVYRGTGRVLGAKGQGARGASDAKAVQVDLEISESLGVRLP